MVASTAWTPPNIAYGALARSLRIMAETFQSEKRGHPVATPVVVSADPDTTISRTLHLADKYRLNLRQVRCRDFRMYSPQSTVLVT